MLQTWSQDNNSVVQQLAMYVSTKQTECHLTVEQLKAFTERYFTIFQTCISGSDLKVKVAAIPAITSFLLSAQDDDDKSAVATVLKAFQTLRDPILDTTVEALKADEDLGKIALESLVELSKSHAVFWQGLDQKLVEIVS